MLRCPWPSGSVLLTFSYLYVCVSARNELQILKTCFLRQRVERLKTVWVWCCRKLVFRHHAISQSQIAHSWNLREDRICPPKTIPESNAKMLILLFYMLKHYFLGSFWVDRPSLSVSFSSGQLNVHAFNEQRLSLRQQAAFKSWRASNGLFVPAVRAPELQPTYMSVSMILTQSPIMSVNA